MTGILNLATAQEFDTVVNESALLVCHFYADWVDQCQHMDKITQELSQLPEYKGLKFAKIPAEEVPEVSLKYKVAAVPTFIIIRRKKEVDRVEGANPGTLINKIKTHINYIKLDKFPETKPAKPVDNINDRLKELVNQAPVMLFMKGNAEEPRCGFSRQIVEILKQLNIDFKTFDILSDSEVREGLKKFSEWPTYPQLYIEGKLIGGLDVVKDMLESGELEKSLPKSVGCIQERLKFLINRAPIMIFMKGNKSKPQCGFSRQLIEILNKNGAQFETFDILQDERVRQELKKFSNWPTYPQVYVKGELIGGLDVIKELEAAGELLSALNTE